MTELEFDCFKKCRLCLGGLEESLEIDDVLMVQFKEVAGKQMIQSPLLSESICIDCQILLDQSYRFKIQILDIQGKLQQLIKLHEKSSLSSCKSAADILINKKTLQNQNSSINKCQFCFKVFKEKRLLRFHIDRVHENRKNFECDLCSYKSYKKYDIILHFRNIHIKDSSSKALCSQCGLVLRNRSDLHRHQQKKHLMIKRFQCDLCNFASFEMSAMKNHQKTHVSLENRRNFPCEVCGKVLTTPNTLKTHLKTVHEKIKEFQCSGCEKSFALKSCLIQHQKSVHEKVREFQCEICQTFVSQASYLKKHKKLMHPPDGVKILFPCDFCSQELSTESALKNHRRIHSDPEFLCEFCDKKFFKKENLLNHMEHHQTLPHPCDHCSRSFRKESLLRNHLKKVHFKEKTTYRCEIDMCLSTFTRRTTYRDHVLRHHKDLNPKFIESLLSRIQVMLPEEQIK